MARILAAKAELHDDLVVVSGLRLGADDLALYCQMTGATDWPRNADGSINQTDPSIGTWRSQVIAHLLGRMRTALDGVRDGQGRDIELVEGDIHAIPFRDGSFDAVVCTYALCSVADDSLAISEMRRVLRPGGRLLLVDHVRSTAPPVYWLQKAYERLPRRNRGEYMTRRPAVHVLEGDCDVVLDERFRWGVVERLMAIKPA